MRLVAVRWVFVIFPDTWRAVDDLSPVAARVTDLRHARPPLRTDFLDVRRVDELKTRCLFIVAIAAQSDEIPLAIGGSVGNVEIRLVLALSALERQPQRFGLALCGGQILGDEIERELRIAR